jgi:hypothetical protein
MFDWLMCCLLTHMTGGLCGFLLFTSQFIFWSSKLLCQQTNYRFNSIFIFILHKSGQFFCLQSDFTKCTWKKWQKWFRSVYLYKHVGQLSWTKMAKWIWECLFAYSNILVLPCSFFLCFWKSQSKYHFML